MNIFLLLGFYSIFILSAMSQESLLSDSDVEIDIGLSFELKKDENVDINFNTEDLILSCSSVYDRVSFLDVEEQADFLREFTEWKLVNELLWSARISMPIERRASAIKRAISVGNHINETAVAAILEEQIHLAVENGEVRYVSLILEFHGDGKLNLTSDQWRKLFESAAIFNFVKSGPSLYLNKLLEKYYVFLVSTKSKSMVSQSYIDLIKNWSQEDVFKTEILMSKLLLD